MTDRTRVALAPGWLLHRYPYRETSMIAEVFTREHGRIGMVARGARAPGRRGAAPIGPFAPMLFTFRQGGELASLHKAESAGPGYRFTGASFLAGCYLNELILRMLARGDAMPDVYALYEEALASLQSDTMRTVRLFEGRLLRLLGYLPALDTDVTGAALQPASIYRYDNERGLVPARDGDRGAVLLAISREDYVDDQVLKAAARLFRGVMTAHLNGRSLRSLDVARSIAMHGTGAS